MDLPLSHQHCIHLGRAEREVQTKYQQYLRATRDRRRGAKQEAAFLELIESMQQWIRTFVHPPATSRAKPARLLTVPDERLLEARMFIILGRALELRTPTHRFMPWVRPRIKGATYNPLSEKLAP